MQREKCFHLQAGTSYYVLFFNVTTQTRAIIDLMCSNQAAKLTWMFQSDLYCCFYGDADGRDHRRAGL